MLTTLILSLFSATVHAQGLSAQDVVRKSPEIAQVIMNVQTKTGLQCLPFLSADPAGLQEFDKNGMPTLWKVTIPCRPAAVGVAAQMLDIDFTVENDIPKLSTFELRVSQTPF